MALTPRQRIVHKFGKAASETENLCRPSEEDVYLEPSQTVVDDEESFWIESIEQSLGLQRPVLKYKAARGYEEEEAAAAGESAAGPADSGKYVPPSRRAGAAMTSKAADMSEKDDRTLRVTNLSETVKEGDLTELFSKMGRVHRVFVAKNQETKMCKGFAFVTMASREMCEHAMRELDGHGYDHLILKVEWAKPAAEPAQRK